ncbi:hypothetical protein [Alkalibacterium kapii]|uniref:DUF4352 domain-containing protein n=1 Tax=Alkalibacterium kapii TaxID=426704 RepID=A0A511AVN2_9LACT|nr:hypothetical protein [Alkalibacterium kapii]GEK91181.1 hypothetical protein AKA01nite_08030 [Alkalibacterium kapii]
MLRNKFLKILLFSSMSLTLASCSSREVQDTDSVEDASTETAESTTDQETGNDAEAETEESTSELGKRSNPVPVGESITYTETYYGDDMESEYEAEFELKVTDVVRGEEAFNTLKAENEFNEAAPEGMEWAIISLEGQLHQGDEDVPYPVYPTFTVVDSDGSEVPQDIYGTFDGNEFGYVDLFPGGTTSGRIAKYMPVDDESLLVLDDMIGSGIYFSL